VYTLDTNAVLYYLKDDTAAVAVLRGIFAETSALYVSAITELELFAYSDLSLDEESLIEELLTTISVIRSTLVLHDSRPSCADIIG